MSCTSGKGCTHHLQALEYIKANQPEHLVLTGSCCSVRGLLGAAPRVTILATDVERLASMADTSDQDRVQLIATSTPSTSLSSDLADMVYLCENADSVSASYFAELAAALKPQGSLLLSARYSRGTQPGAADPEEPDPGRPLSEWTELLTQAGFSQVSTLDEQNLVLSFKSDGSMEYSISNGIIRASKGGKI